jgi:hypothetical protein
MAPLGEKAIESILAEPSRTPRIDAAGVAGSSPMRQEAMLIPTIRNRGSRGARRDILTDDGPLPSGKWFRIAADP